KRRNEQRAGSLPPDARRGAGERIDDRADVNGHRLRADLLGSGGVGHPQEDRVDPGLGVFMGGVLLGARAAVPESPSGIRAGRHRSRPGLENPPVPAAASTRSWLEPGKLDSPTPCAPGATPRSPSPRTRAT